MTSIGMAVRGTDRLTGLHFNHAHRAMFGAGALFGDNPAQLTARKIERFDGVFVDDGQLHLEFPLFSRFILGP